MVWRENCSELAVLCWPTRTGFKRLPASLLIVWSRCESLPAFQSFFGKSRNFAHDFSANAWSSPRRGRAMNDQMSWDQSKGSSRSESEVANILGWNRRHFIRSHLDPSLFPPHFAPSLPLTIMLVPTLARATRTAPKVSALPSVRVAAVKFLPRTSDQLTPLFSSNSLWTEPPRIGYRSPR